MALTRSKPLKRTAMKPYRWKPAVPAEVREQLVARSGGWCELRLPGCLGGATDPSHRKTQKAGGRHGAAKVEHDQLSDVMDACRACHRWVHARVREAREMGLMLEEWQNPEDEFVVYRGKLSYLTNDGRVLDYFETNAAALVRSDSPEVDRA